MSPTRIYLAPGMFGFASLAAYDYFGHVARALADRFGVHGREVEVHVCEVHPTASIRRRAAKLAEMVAHTAGHDDGPIHLLGHSTGGLDARLVASPSVHLGRSADLQLGDWLDRLRSITAMNTPHFGTPLASFFATAKGQHLLYAVSALTVAGLTLGAPPLAAASALVAAFGRSKDVMGLEVALVDRVADAVTSLLDEASSRALRAWLAEIRDDQGAVMQLTPEAMDLFLAGVEDRPGVRYQCVATYAPPSGAREWLRAVTSPWVGLSAAVFHLMSSVTEIVSDRYPCSPPDGGGREQLARALGQDPPRGANDGVVPLRSQLWGEPVWVGKGDHLDVVGHFPGPGGHTDWLTSGARFDVVRFQMLMDRVAAGMIAAE